MDAQVNEIVTGRKTFFILPDSSLMPSSFLEDFFSLGYECYYIEFDKRIDTKKMIEVILSLFKDIIVFFNVDSYVDDIKWDSYIEELLEKSENVPLFGVMYSKRQTSADKAMIEKRFLYDMGLQCGCVQLEYKKNENFDLLSRTLYANQAQGRRKTIRAMCNSACTYTFFKDNKEKSNSGTLQDISLSHFSILKEKEDFNIKLYEKISDIHFNIRGFLFQSDAILVMERPVEDKMLYVFSFVNSSGANGLNDRVKHLFIPVLYKMISTACRELIDEYYFKGDKLNADDTDKNDLYVEAEKED